VAPWLRGFFILDNRPSPIDNPIMTSTAFRKLALTLPEVTEVGHMGHPDFRVAGKIFATLFTKDEIDYAMAKLTPVQQRQFMTDHPGDCTPASGAWGTRGATIFHLSKTKPATAKAALLAAWVNTAPKKLIEQLDRDSK